MNASGWSVKEEHLGCKFLNISSDAQQWEYPDNKVTNFTTTFTDPLDLQNGLHTVSVQAMHWTNAVINVHDTSTPAADQTFLNEFDPDAKPLKLKVKAGSMDTQTNKKNSFVCWT